MKVHVEPDILNRTNASLATNLKIEENSMKIRDYDGNLCKIDHLDQNIGHTCAHVHAIRSWILVLIHNSRSEKEHDTLE